MTITTATSRGRPASVRRNKATSDKMPPSPSLSARIIRNTYPYETTIVIAQNTIEMMPNTSSRLGATALCSALNTVCKAYSGLVPISPNTTPRAASANAPNTP